MLEKHGLSSDWQNSWSLAMHDIMWAPQGREQQGYNAGKTQQQC
jgi:hypothetical protein